MATQWDWAFQTSHITLLSFLVRHLRVCERMSVCLCVSAMLFLSLTSVCMSLYGQDMSIISEIHQRICVTPSYFLLGFDITLLSSRRPVVCCSEGKNKKPLHSSPLACSTHSRLYRFPLKLHLQKTGRMWALIFPTLCNTWSGVAR